MILHQSSNPKSGKKWSLQFPSNFDCSQINPLHFKLIALIEGKIKTC